MNIATKTKVKLYSYARFSSDQQKDNDSIHRQLTLAEEFVATHPQYNFELINEYEDDGRSAYHGKHLTVGRLGEFLKDVKAGRIEKGSWCGIEDFDRLDRRNYLDAKVVFEELINSGITIVVFRTGKVFDLASLRSNPFDFMMALMSMVSANEYTERMSHRARKAWKAKREAAVTTGKIMSANVPEWIDTIVDEVSSTGKPLKQHFELNVEKAKIARQIVDVFIGGLGCQSLARKLTLAGTPCLRKGKYWGPPNVRAVLRNPALKGTYVHKPKKIEGEPLGEPVVIESYYPIVCTRAEFDECQQLLKSTNNTKLRKDPTLANPLAALCRCSECNSIMTRVSQKAYRGRKPYEKLVCIGAKSGNHKYRSIPIDAVTGQLFMLLRFPQAFGSQDDGVMAGYQTKRADMEARVTRLTDAIGTVGLSDALQRSLAGVEGDLAALDKLIEEEASKSVYGNAKRMAERQAEALRAMQSNSMDAQGLNAALRRLFKEVRVDIEAGELFVEWLNGKVSVLTV